ncbi:MAG: acetylglutamate kinase [Methermicoccaceae archaeon]
MDDISDGAYEKSSALHESLIAALPRIREYRDSVMIVKIGGNAIIDQSVMEKTMEDLVMLHFLGIRVILVHGGGPEISEKMKKIGKEAKFVGGLRVTDDETLEIVRMVLVGNVNFKLTSLLMKHGGMAVGISGKDGGLITARKKAPERIIIDDKEQEVDIGWVGDVVEVKPHILQTLMDAGYIPVIAPVAIDKEGNTLNVNADTVAGEIAASLDAQRLIMMTDVPGILRNPSDTSSRIETTSLEELRKLIRNGIVAGGMLPKVKAVMYALENGVHLAHIVDGGVPHSLLLELLSKDGTGTRVFP